MLAYMAVVFSYDHTKPELIQDTVYHIARQKLAGPVYAQLTDGGLDFRRRMAGNPLEFQSQMAFYVVKPLYTRMVYYLYKVGVPIIPATLLPSLIFYILIGVLLVFWLIRWLHFFLALGVSCLLMISAPMWELVRTSSPDCLSAFLLLGALFFMTERKLSLVTFLFLVLSVFARLDNIIPAFFFITLMCFSKAMELRISYWKYGWMLLLILACYFFISHNADPYSYVVSPHGWGVLYYPGFFRALNLSYVFHPGFQFKDYFALAISHIMTGLFYSNLLLFLALALILFSGGDALRPWALNADQVLVIVIILIMILRFILQPVITDRFYIAYYLCIAILLIKKLNASGKHLSLAGSHPPENKIHR